MCLASSPAAPPGPARQWLLSAPVGCGPGRPLRACGELARHEVALEQQTVLDVVRRQGAVHAARSPQSAPVRVSFLMFEPVHSLTA